MAVGSTRASDTLPVQALVKFELIFDLRTAREGWQAKAARHLIQINVRASLGCKDRTTLDRRGENRAISATRTFQKRPGLQVQT
jgi:hypothetical protein